jgi:Zn-dependent protease with chaperone function
LEFPWGANGSYTVLVKNAVTHCKFGIDLYLVATFEYEADAFARATMGEAQSLVQALRKLTGQNLSNLMPHPLYSNFYCSHPTLLERERALQAARSL